MNGRYQTSNARVLRILAVLVLAILIVGGFLAVHYAERGGKQPVEAMKKQISYEGNTYTLRKNLETTLVIGVDSYSSVPVTESYKNGQQADFLLLVVRDKKTGECSAIHINRDTMAYVRVLGVGGRVVDTVFEQIALSHAYGTGSHDSCLNTVRAVSGLLLDVTIDHYMAITMDAVAELNDLVGGVEVYVEDDFSAIDPALVQGETVTLHGEQALLFVRARSEMEDKTNLHRMERQRQYMTALWAKVSEMAENDELKTDDTRDLFDYVVTDYSVSQLQDLAERIGSLTMDSIRPLEGASVVGTEFMEFYPDEDALTRLVLSEFYCLDE